MTSDEERLTTSIGQDHHSGASVSGDRDASVVADGSQTPRLVVSWLIVGLPLAYGIYQTISKTLPLFGG